MRDFTPLRVEITHNNAAINVSCAWCGSRTQAQVDDEPFVAGTRQLLCHSCGSAGELVGEMPEGFSFFIEEYYCPDCSWPGSSDATCYNCGRRPTPARNDFELDIDEIPF